MTVTSSLSSRSMVGFSYFYFTKVRFFAGLFYRVLKHSVSET